MRRLVFLVVLLASLMVPAIANAASVLGGDQTVESNADTNSSGNPQAWRVDNMTAGTAQTISLFVGGNDTATGMNVGLYTNSNGHPGSLLAQGSKSSLTKGAWNTVTLGSQPILTATKYWVAAVGKGGGVLGFKDRVAGTCNTEISSKSGLTSLQATWTTGQVWTNAYCPASAYVSGTASSGTPPSNTVAPVISGMTQQGSTLTVSNGSWSGTTPMTFSYQWQDCTPTCLSISGATSSSYVLQSSDVGDTIDAVVTASNSAGSTPASSSAVGPVTASGGGGGGCDLNATPSNFSSQVSAATADQTVCLASGNYGTWTGTNKAITVTAASGASPTMQVNFASGASGFTLSGMSGMSGTINSPASNITISDSTFTNTLDIGGLANANVTLDGDSFNNQNEAANCNDEPARLHLSYGSTTPSGVTVENSVFIDPVGGLSNPKDGIQTGVGMVIKNNVFENILDNPSSCNHTDSVQAVGVQGMVVQGNFFNNDADGFVDFDDSTSDTVTDNACTAIENFGKACVVLDGDLNSTVNHNASGDGTAMMLSYKTGSGYRGSSTGTVIENNVGVLLASDPNDHPATVTHNLYPGASSPDINGSPVFAGGSNPSTWSGFELAPGSPGVGAATDGSDVGIRASAGGPPGS